MKRLFSKEDDMYILDHYQTTPYATLAEHFGLTERQVRGHINNMGLTKSIKKDGTYFDAIDTKEKSYWLGFLFADGWIYSNRKARSYCVGLELHKNDIAILERFVSDVGYDTKILFRNRDICFNGYSYTADTCYVRIFSKHMFQSLMNHGIVQDKTHSDIYPRIDHFQNAFIRGFMDGDGCICDNKHGHISLSFTNPNYDFLLYINEIISQSCGVSGHMYKEKDLKYRLTFTGDMSVKSVLDWLYAEDDGLHLDRKFHIYKSHYGLAA